MKPNGYAARILSWYRAGHLKRLEASARSAAVAYQVAKARYESAIIAERLRGEEA